MNDDVLKTVTSFQPPIPKIGFITVGRSTMRIDIQTIIAVLFLAAILFPCLSHQNDQQLVLGQKSRRSGSRKENKISDWSFSRPNGFQFEESESRPWLTHRDHLMLLRQEGGEEGHAVECCPSVLDMIEPEGGKNLEDIYVELYSDGENRQRFYERSCREDIVNKPCRFLDKKLYNQSRCVQKYSYTYALVRDATVSELMEVKSRRNHHHHHHQHDHQHDRRKFISKDWKMDYIRVRSGCSCEVLPKLKKKRNSKNKKNHRSRKFQFEFETDET